MDLKGQYMRQNYRKYVNQYENFTEIKKDGQNQGEDFSSRRESKVCPIRYQVDYIPPR